MGVEHSGVNFKFKMNEARAREPNKRTIIDEVQPVLPCSSVPRAAVIGVAKLADFNFTSSSFETLEEVGYSTFSNKDPPGIESLSICDKLSNDQLQGERREEKKSNAIIVIILLVVLAVVVAALFANLMLKKAAKDQFLTREERKKAAKKRKDERDKKMKAAKEKKDKRDEENKRWRAERNSRIEERKKAALKDADNEHHVWDL